MQAEHRPGRERIPTTATGGAQPAVSTPPSGILIGILTADPINLRLIEDASLQLQLTPVSLTGQSLSPDTLAGLEIIVADELAAIEISAILSAREEDRRPTIVAIRLYEPESNTASSPPGPPPSGLGSSFAGLLHLPQSPALITAQLSVILYSHRAFAQRYQSALDELSLNRRIFRSVTSGITVADATHPDFPLTYVNPAFEVMTGFTLEEVQGKNCRFLQKEERDQPALASIREAIQTRQETVAVLRNFRKDGTPFWNELSLSPIRNRDGQVTHFVGIQNDVTARVEFEAALRESEKLAAVGRLASSIAHEINNPLESVMNLVYLAQHTDMPEEIHQYLATADKELQRVKLITARSLRFYKQSTRAQSVAASDLVNSVLDVYQSRLHNHSVSVARRERSIKLILCMDSEIRQVLNNLVSNAIDSMNIKGGLLHVRTREATEWRSGVPGVMFTIGDTGTGISPDTMKNVYKAFYTTKGIGGTGLGLWISSEIVDRHHGRLMVRSSQRSAKSGTVFQLFLPHESAIAS